MANVSNLEEYAPLDQRRSERLSKNEQAMVSGVESELRDVARTDISFLRRQRSEIGVDDSLAAENLNATVRRIAVASMEEVDRVISELQSIREMLGNEGARVSREVSGYASLGHATETAMKVFADSLKQWKGGQR